MDYIIYGAGGNGQKIYDALVGAGHHIKYFIDLYATASSYRDTPIFKPDAVTPEATTVLVSVSCISHQIKQQLMTKGFASCLDLNEILKTFEPVFAIFFNDNWIKMLRESDVKYGAELDQLAGMLADEQSRRCLSRIREFRRQPSCGTYLENDWLVQYFPPELVAKGLLPETLRMIDCGAYDGDTLRRTLAMADQYGVCVQSVVCFEPDPSNYEKLSMCIRTVRPDNVRVLAIPAGVWSTNTLLQFSSQSDKSSAINIGNQMNSHALQVVRLDDVCFGQAPNFIKMDVEGADGCCRYY